RLSALLNACTVRRMSTIVVGYDESDAAERALDRAIEEARDKHVRLLVVSVLEMPLNPEGLQNYGTLDDSPPPGMPAGPPPEHAACRAGRKQGAAAPGLDADYFGAAGEPADTIVGAARDRRASLIVLGTHHHSLFGRIFGKDVAAGVKREADCDVLVVD